MQYKIFKIIVLLGLIVGCGKPVQSPLLEKLEKPPMRIISTAPSITETLFALGYGNRVVGVTQFCKFPEEAQKLPKVGALLDANYETILELNPDMVVLLEENSAMQQRLNTLRIPWLAVDHRSIDGILKSYEMIMRQCESQENSEKMAEIILMDSAMRLSEIREKTKNIEKKPTVLIALREMPETSIQIVMVAGANPFFQEALEIAGGENVMKNPRTAFPTISRETVFELNPDVIIDIAPLAKKQQFSADEFIASWDDFGDHVNAVKNKQVYFISEDYAVVPGPRFLLFIEELARILHGDDVVRIDNKIKPPENESEQE